MILTNPDMLHVEGSLHHDRWGDVLHNLRYIVVDEAHVYRGVAPLRRQRLGQGGGSRVSTAPSRALLASATIATLSGSPSG